MKLVLHSFAALACSLSASEEPRSLAATPQNQVAPAAPTRPKGAPPPTAPVPASRAPGSPRVFAGPLFVNGSDNCSTPDPISGGGPHSFDNTAATTDGCSNCQPCGLIQKDVWFTWTAPSTGSWTISLCGGTSGMDSVVAVYNGTSCPSAPALACNDDFCGVISRLVFSATGGSSYVIQVGSFSTSPGGSGSFTLSPGVPPSNDDCSTPVAIAGPGPHPFDTTAATTGIQGQAEPLCLAFATTAINNDEWYTWTAGASGLAQLTTCSQTSVDTKIAVYPGAGCPAAPALGCNDDACSVQSSVCFSVTSGSSYTIQLGTFPGAPGGSGTFTITVAPPLSPCRYDDGVTENLLGWIAGGEMVWMQRFGSTGGSTTVSNIRVAWGSAAFPGLGPGNGSAAKVAIWDDPNDDGDPSDAVLIQVVGTTVALVDTDTFVTIPITPVLANGAFFLGAGLSHAAGQFVAPMDTSCPISGVAWFFGNDNATPADYSNVQNNANPPASFDSAGFPSVVMVRGTCAVSPGITFCEPGVGGVMPCSCGNPPSGPGRGCDNSAGTGGATLTDTGVASLAADTVVFTTTAERPTALSIVLQGNALISSGTPYGDGVRCTGGALKRLYVKTASGGSITAPTGGDPSVHARSAALGDTIVAGTLRYYQVYYRDPLSFACPSPGGATFNTSSGRKILWSF